MWQRRIPASAGWVFITRNRVPSTRTHEESPPGNARSAKDAESTQNPARRATPPRGNPRTLLKGARPDEEPPPKMQGAGKALLRSCGSDECHDGRRDGRQKQEELGQCKWLIDVIINPIVGPSLRTAVRETTEKGFVAHTGCPDK